MFPCVRTLSYQYLIRVRYLPIRSISSPRREWTLTSSKSSCVMTLAGWGLGTLLGPAAGFAASLLGTLGGTVGLKVCEFGFARSSTASIKHIRLSRSAPFQGGLGPGGMKVRMSPPSDEQCFQSSKIFDLIGESIDIVMQDLNLSRGLGIRPSSSFHEYQRSSDRFPHNSPQGDVEQ
jgi:hypothetical protein